MTEPGPFLAPRMVTGRKPAAIACSGIPLALARASDIRRLTVVNDDLPAEFVSPTASSIIASVSPFRSSIARTEIASCSVVVLPCDSYSSSTHASCVSGS